MASTDDFDYGADAAPPTEHFAARLARAAIDHQAATMRLTALAAEVKAAQEEVRVLEEVTIPEILAEAGLREAKTSDGLEITLKRTVHASLPGEKEQPQARAAALAWLEEAAPSIIKRTVEVPLGKGADRLADVVEGAIEDLARKLGTTIDHRRNINVHPQTLAAWVRERMAAGGDVPDGTVVVHRRTVAEVKRPRKDG